MQNHTAIVTGAAGQIGRATTHKLLQGGAQVLMVDADQAALDEAAHAMDGRVETAVCDVRDSEQVASYVKTCEQHFGQVDAFFNNAAIEGDMQPLTEYDEATFQKVLDINVKGVWLGCKHVMPAMARSGGGSIVITSSVAGLTGTPNLLAYTTSKHAVIGIMRTAAKEGAPQGIRANTINPGPIESRMMQAIEEGNQPEQPEQVHQAFESQIPMGRYGRAEEVARLAVFLLSGDSTYANGAVFPLDGGFTA